MKGAVFMWKRFGVIITVLAAVVVVYLLLLERQGDRPAVAPSLTKKDLPSLPNVSLQVNGEDELLIHQGTPLIFSVRLANQQAMNAAAYNEANQTLIEEIRADVSSGKISKEEAEAEIAQLSKKAEIKVVQLGSDHIGWEQFVRFGLRLPDGREQPLSWPLRLVAPPQAKSVTLDAENTYQLDYGLEPAAAAKVLVGEYRVVVVLEVAAEAKLPADRWRGRVESDPVAFKVMEKPARLSPVDEEKMHLDFARYFSTTGELPRSLEHAQKVLAINPQSIPAHILAGDVKEGQGDLRGALEAYQSAVREYYRQHPKPYEAPRYLIYKTTSLMEKLKLTEQPRRKE
jgi:tetratricopeptide (TPR) repeat protein